MAITLEQFREYERVRKSGAVSMLLTRTVAKRAKLTPAQVLEIQRRFFALSKKYDKDL